VDGIGSSGRIPPDQIPISEHIREKGGQGTRPQYYAQKRTQPEPLPEPEEEETPAPEETGKPKRLIDIKV